MLEIEHTSASPSQSLEGRGSGASRVAQLKSTPRQHGEASFFYRDHHFQYDAVKVLPGEYFVTGENLVIVTILGSCISSCIWDRTARVGGLNHFMLPDGNNAGMGGRYGSYAMELLINEMLKLGAHRETMQAKIFGGARIMASLTSLNVGEQNTAFVLDYLSTERIPVVSQDVLDTCPRKVCFFPASGKALVKRLANVHPETISVDDRRGSAMATAKTSTGGSVDLFEGASWGK